jgi:hypothetical protein
MVWAAAARLNGRRVLRPEKARTTLKLPPNQREVDEVKLEATV